MDIVFDLVCGEFAGEQRRLTQREIAIVSLIAAGQSNKEIAIQLGVAPETIKTHLKRIFLKLSARTRAEAVVRAQSTGLNAPVPITPPLAIAPNKRTGAQPQTPRRPSPDLEPNCRVRAVALLA